MNNMYKLYQLMSFFVMKFSYKTLNIGDSSKKEELWLFNPSHQFYPIIRATLNSIEQVIFEKERVDNIVSNVFRNFHISNGRLLDIHITNEEITDNEVYDSISLNSNYYSGIEVNDIYPGIHNVVHEVNDPNAEISEIVHEINSYTKQARIQKKNLKVKLPVVTTVSIVICVIMYLIEILMMQKYGSIDPLVVLGANYKTFTVGLYEFYRLLSSAFLHGNIFHLIMNMYALYNMGRFMETEMGSLKFAIILYMSVIFGSLTSLMFGSNSISIGISGGLYGLMGVFLVIAFKNNRLKEPSTMQVIMLNILINFMGGVDVFAHLGGLLSGVVLYYALFEKKPFIIMYIAMLIVLTIKVYTVEEITPKYAGTDMKVVEIYRDLGMDKRADKLLEKLNKFYIEK